MEPPKGWKRCLVIGGILGLASTLPGLIISFTPPHGALFRLSYYCLALGLPGLLLAALVMSESALNNALEILVIIVCVNVLFYATLTYLVIAIMRKVRSKTG